MSDNTQNAILAAREAGPFKSKADFIARVEKRKCNSKHQSILDRVGAFASVEEDQPPSNSPTRVKDQLELMPGLVSARVNVGREVVWDEFTKEQILKLVIAPAMEIASAPVNPRASKKVKVMVITDAATKQEEKAGTMMNGSNADYIKHAIEEAGGKWNQGYYYTAWCKVPKRDKKLTAEEMKQWTPLLKTEIGIIGAPVIVAMGSEIARHFVPDMKGPVTDHVGKVVYNKELDANIVIGMTLVCCTLIPARLI
ncbi:AAA family ATPase [Xanthomonas phage JGB6]|nr:AAA family ATPase [Xanthomonas phage JGB6]